uniref:GRIP domain-containing protein n=1 Tax=Clastoptera arizonana TaxID=38151 RepID=A0A1B6DGY6_9HEMI
MNNGDRRHSGESRIPVLSSPSPLRRSGSQRLGGCPPILEQRPVLNRHRSLQSLTTTPITSRYSPDQEDDLDSLRSYGSCASACSTASQCDHANFARNGTTYSGRRKRYVVHCSPHSTAGDEYLTPTQRANRTIRKLKSLLTEAQSEIEEKDRQILRITKEVVQLRLLKVDSAAEVTEPDSSGRLNDTINEQAPITMNGGRLSSPLVVDLPASLADSGHFEDLSNGKDWFPRAHRDATQKETEQLQRQHEDIIRDLKEKQNDRVDALLLRITETNDRYYDQRSKLEDQKIRIGELEKENNKLKEDKSSDQRKIEELRVSNEQLKLQLENLDFKLNEYQMMDIDLGNVEKLEIDNRRNEEIEKENEELTMMISKNAKEKADIEMKLQSLLSENEKIKMENIKLGSLELENKQIEKENVDLKLVINKYLQEKSDLEIKFDLVVKENEELKTKCCKVNELNEQLTKNNQIIKVQGNNMTNRDERVEILEREIERLKLHHEKQEEHHKNVYLEMYKKGQESARFEDNEALDASSQEEKSYSTSELLKNLENTKAELENIKAMYKRILETKKSQPEHDPEMTLQFLKSAIYYFLTDKENTQGHLAAIESILGFTENEKINIDRAFLWR